MKTKKYNVIALLFLHFLGGIFTVAAQQKEPWTEDVTQGKLDNGLTYFIVPQGTRGKLELSMVSRIGALAERPEEHGYTHVLEHMLFKGSENYPGDSCYVAMENMGMRRGKEFQAFTAESNTRYNLIIPENNIEHFKQSLILFKEWMFRGTIDPDVLETEKQVVIEEIKRGGNAPSLALRGTSMEGHDVLGSIEDIESIDRDQLYAYYKRYYVPENLAIIVYGQFEEDLAVDLIKSVFSDVNPKEESQPLAYPELWHNNIFQDDYSLNGGLQDNMLTILVKEPEQAGLSAYEKLKNNYVSSLFGKLLASRYRSATTQKGRLNYSDIDLIPGNSISILKLTSQDTIRFTEMLDKLCYALAQIQRYGVSQEEMESLFLSNKGWLEDKKDSKTMKIGQIRDFFTYGVPPLNGQNRYQLFTQFQKEITSEDFIALASRHIKGAKTVLVNKSDSAYSEDFNAVNVWESWEQIGDLAPKPFLFQKRSKPMQKQQVTQNLLEEFGIAPPAAGIINKRESLEGGLTYLQLSNGANVILDPYDSNLEFTVSVMTNGGLDKVPADKRFLMEATQGLLNWSFSELTPEENGNLSRSLNVKQRVNISDFYTMYEAKGQSELLAQTLQHFYLFLERPIQIETDRYLNSYERFYRLKLKNITEYEQFLDSVNLSGVSRPVPLENKEIDPEQLLSYRRNFLADLDKAVIYIKGRLPEDIEALVATYLGGLSPSELNEERSDPDAEILPGKVIHRDFGWKRPVGVVNYLFTRIPKAPVSLKSELILEGISQFSNVKMLQVLREKYGLVYSSGTTAKSTNRPFNFQSLSVRYMMDTINITRSERIMEEEVLSNLSKGKINDVEVARMKAVLINTYLTDFYEMEQMDLWFRMNLRHGRIITPGELRNTINEITPGDVRKMMKELFDMESHFILIRRPEGELSSQG